MFKDYHNELSAILRTFQNQQYLVDNCREPDYLTERERDILYALVMKEIDSLIEPTSNLAGESGLTEPVSKVRELVWLDVPFQFVDPHMPPVKVRI